MIGFLVHNSEKWFFSSIKLALSNRRVNPLKSLSLSTVARCSVIDTVRFTVKNKELPFVIEIIFHISSDGKHNRYLFFPQPIPNSSIHDLVFVVFAVYLMNSSYNLFPVEDNTLILWYHSEVIKLCTVYPVVWVVVSTQIDGLRKPLDRHPMYLLSHCIWARQHYAFSEFPRTPVSKRG